MGREGRGWEEGRREREGMEQEVGKVTERMGGTGQDTGWDGEERQRERRKGRERKERGYTPNFNSWRRHC